MTRKLIGYVETKLLLVGVLMACLCGVTAYGLYRHLAALRADAELLMSSNLRAHHLVTTLSLLQDAETGQRGYLLTGRADYLEPYNYALQHIERSLSALQEDYANSSLAQEVVSSIGRQTRAKLAELETTVGLRRQEGLEAAQRTVMQGTGKRLMDEIRTDVTHLLTVERAEIDRAAFHRKAGALQDVSFWLLAAAVAFLPASFCLVLACRDVRRSRRKGAHLAYASSHDALTGLLNRSAFLARLDAALSHRPREVGLLYIDLNGFKPINDDLGHATGDRVLAEVGRRLQDAVGDPDAVARLGGDEFVVLVERCQSRASLTALSLHIEAALDTISLPELHGRRISGCAGVAYSA